MKIVWCDVWMQAGNNGRYKWTVEECLGTVPDDDTVYEADRGVWNSAVR